MSLFGEPAVKQVEDFSDSWAPVKTNDLEQDLDLDCLFDDIQPEPVVPEPVELDLESPWSAFPTTSSFGGSSLLQEIAVSIPSAACLTESILFD